jgi:colicin import membrane protein
MEALSLAPRKLAGGDLVTALAASVVAHFVVIFVALFVPELMPRKSIQVPFYAVNLVTMDEFKGPVAPPLKGEGGKAASSPVQEKKSSAKASANAGSKSSSPLVPVKRLRFDDSNKKTTTEVKKLETTEAPKIATRTEGVSSLEKDLEKLTKKPKTAKPAPSSVESPQPEAAPAKEKTGAERASSGKSNGSSNEKAAGVPEGSPGGSSQANAGSGQVGLARRLYYTEIWNAVRSNWALPDFLKDQKLEAVLIVTLRRDGSVTNLRFEKRSGNGLFDESAERAVRKAEPLPPFPAIYSPAQEDIGLRFRPEDL